MKSAYLYSRCKGLERISIENEVPIAARKIGNFVNSFDWFKSETLGTEDKY